MKLAIVGGTGRTGRHLVDAAVAAGHWVSVLARTPFEQPGVHVVPGDALDRDVLRVLVRGADAVVCVLGPTPSSPPELCSRATELLIDAMKAEGINRLVVQTGAMAGHPALGFFYRRLAAALRGQLDDRRAQERLVQNSGLDWTLIRPPRLRGGRGTGALQVGPSLPVAMLSSVARVDLARVLLEAATKHAWSAQAVTTLPGLSSLRPGVVLRSWVWRMGLAELLGIGFAAAVATAFLSTWGEPQSFPAALAFLGCMLGAGALEGALLGFLPGRLLARGFPRLSLRAFGRNTLAVALGAWLLGMLPSTLMTGPSPATPAQEPSAWLIVVFSSLGGALAGALMGTAQWLALRKAVPRAGRWILASMIGWALALPLDVLGGTLPGPGDSWVKTVSVAAALGLLAGLLVALPTGMLLLQMLRERDAPAQPA
jgi:uncharacterized protein YbjT (DUF2867 family)